MDMLPFLDIETTGLDSQRDQVLEIGVVVMSDDLTGLVTERNWVLPLEHKYPLSDFILDMHSDEKNGLLSECYQSWNYAAFDEIDEWFSSTVKGKPPLCGSSVHFDRSFCSTRKFIRHFSYRNVDVSSIKELCQRWAPEVYEKRPRGQKKHRALPDCWDTINELRYYREHFLKG